LRALGNHVIIDPLYDPVKFGSLYLPDAFENKYPHQGDVVACGPDFPFKPGTRVALRSFVVEPIDAGGRLLAIRGEDCIARIEGKELYPKPTQVLVLPDWHEKFDQPSRTIIISDVELDDGKGLTRGTVARAGEKVTTVKAGDYVLFPPNKGVEIGYIDTNWYVFEEDELLATMERA
jgi:co-chaperonin GroES (HSP10)